MQKFVNRKIYLAIDQLREAIDELYEAMEATKSFKSFQAISTEILKLKLIISELKEAEL